MKFARRWAAAGVLAAAIIVLVACGGGSLKRVGESCSSSSECDTALICDFASHTCAAMGSIDGPAVVDAAVIDALPDARPIDGRPDALLDAPPDALPDAPPDAL